MTPWLRHARHFPQAAVATPHYLATAAGLTTLAGGGNAVDAAIAANLTLAVVTPYMCGPGGDLLVQVWDGNLHGYLGVGRAPEAATLEDVRERAPSATFPTFGPLTVTVPGAVRGWFDLLERWGTRSFGDLAATAIRYAEGGFPLSAKGAWYFDQARRVYDHFDLPDFGRAYPETREGGRVMQPPLGRTLRTLAADGPDAYYKGPIGAAIAARLQECGSCMTEADIARHEGDWVVPLVARFAGLDVSELPPPTQGVAALEAMCIVDGLDLPPDGPERAHLMIEAMKLALADRNCHVADPDAMTIAPTELLTDVYIAEQRARIDPAAASSFPLDPQPDGGTVYFCAADGDGLMVSIIQSNFFGAGSGIRVDEWGLNLHNRGSSFRLDAGHPQAIGPRRRPMHTLIPAFARRDGEPALVFGSEGGHQQAQAQLQFLTRIAIDGTDLQAALDAPRWTVDPASGAVAVEDRVDPDWVDALRAKGHAVTTVPGYGHGMGYAHVIEPTATGYRGASDPRAEGGIAGL